jgi:hypothetical protein
MIALTDNQPGAVNGRGAHVAGREARRLIAEDRCHARTTRARALWRRRCCGRGAVGHGRTCPADRRCRVKNPAHQVGCLPGPLGLRTWCGHSNKAVAAPGATANKLLRYLCLLVGAQGLEAWTR